MNVHWDAFRVHVHVPVVVVFPLVVPFDRQNASRSARDTDGTGGAVKRRGLFHFVHVRDDDDGAAGIPRDGNQVVEFRARFVRGVQRTAVADIRAERIKKEKTCVEFFDCFFDSVITEGQVLFVFADKDQSFTVAVGSDEP